MTLFIRDPFAQTINLSGTVKGATGLTQSGATVVLVKKNITTTTAADGTYRISSGSGSINHPTRGIDGFSIVNNILTIRIASQVPLSIALFDLAGKQISQIYKGLCTPPVFELPIDQRCRSMQSAVLVVNLDGRTTTVRIMRSMNLLVPGVINKQSTGLTKSASPAQKNLTLSILDTLKVTQGTSTIRLYVYNWIDTMDFVLGESDLYSEARQQGVHRINTYRSSLGLSALLRRTDRNACLDSQAQSDAASNTAHGAFGRCGESAQNECPGWNTIAAIYTSCMQMMWDEGPPPSVPCTGTCFSTYGHFINMSNPLYKNAGYPTYTRVGFGFAPAANNKYWSVQDFW